MNEAKEFLQKLLQLFKGQQIASTYEYVEVTEDGDELSEQFHIE